MERRQSAVNAKPLNKMFTIVILFGLKIYDDLIGKIVRFSGNSSICYAKAIFYTEVGLPIMIDREYSSELSEIHKLNRKRKS